jgi:hypothetical protein
VAAQGGADMAPTIHMGMRVGRPIHQESTMGRTVDPLIQTSR